MANVAMMTLDQRLGEALSRSKAYLAPDVGRFIGSFLSPTNLAILGGTLVVWAGSHFFGVGEIVDVLLLVVGAFTIGWSVGDVAELLYTFADKTVNAQTDADLDAAA